VYDLAFIAAFGLAAFLVAWVVNGLVGMMSGENPRDTGRLGLEVFLRLFAILELGVIGRMLSYVGLVGRPRKVVLFVGLLCVLAFLVRACHDSHSRDTRFERMYGVTNGELYEIKTR
jgi:predicted branched-subunit amino acid permease